MGGIAMFNAYEFGEALSASSPSLSSPFLNVLIVSSVLATRRPPSTVQQESTSQQASTVHQSSNHYSTSQLAADGSSAVAPSPEVAEIKQNKEGETVIPNLGADYDKNEASEASKQIEGNVDQTRDCDREGQRKMRSEDIIMERPDGATLETLMEKNFEKSINDIRLQHAKAKEAMAGILKENRAVEVEMEPVTAKEVTFAATMSVIGKGDPSSSKEKEAMEDRSRSPNCPCLRRNEEKTKPTKHSMRELRALGLTPHFLRLLRDSHNLFEVLNEGGLAAFTLLSLDEGFEGSHHFLLINDDFMYFSMYLLNPILIRH
ncbi:uncharacterized protein LOC115996045 [Ipomoea triloba]|uniref:uncharacterized protein LOC115996045 n=1 Tax=Ipomoea triloba TaxID=35885 RepID=UPI00125E177C|nr:uncharacterized protein LOC115996045 [Ipomoea triloba]